MEMTKIDIEWINHLVGFYEQELNPRERGMFRYYQELGYLDHTPTGRIYLLTLELLQ